MDINGISASSYSTYDWCQWKWFLQYALREKDIAGYSALVGTIAHKTLEILSKVSSKQEFDDEDNEILKDTDPADYLNEHVLFQKCQDYYYLKEPENAAKLEAKPKKISSIKDGIEWLMSTKHNPKIANTICAEKVIGFHMTGPQWITGKDKSGEFEYFKIRGKIDRIDRIDDDTLEIIDYKTGGLMPWPPKNNNKEKTLEDFYRDIQCLIYYYGCKRLYPEAKSIIVTFIFIAHEKKFSVCLGPTDVEHLKDRLFSRFIEIKNNNSPEQNRGFWCKHICNFGKDGTCQKIWKEKNKYGIDFVTDFYQVRNNIEHSKPT